MFLHFNSHVQTFGCYFFSFHIIKFFLWPQITFVSISFRKHCKERIISIIELGRSPVYQSRHRPVMPGSWGRLFKKNRIALDYSIIKSKYYFPGYWANGPLYSELEPLRELNIKHKLEEALKCDILHLRVYHMIQALSFYWLFLNFKKDEVHTFSGTLPFNQGQK